MRAFDRRMFSAGCGRQVGATFLTALLLLSFPALHFAQNTLQRLVGTGELPPPGSYEYRLSVVNNSGIDIRQGLFTRVIYRGKWLGPVLRDHQITAARDVAFILAEETGTLRGAIFLREATTGTVRRIVQIGDPTPEGETFTRLLEFSLNDSRQILFTAETSGPPPEDGIPRAGLFLANDSGIRTLLMTGATTPEGTILGFSSPRLTNDGSVYFTASVRTAQGAVQTVIFRRTGQSLDRLVRTGDAVAAGGTLTTPVLQAVSPLGDAIAFLDQTERALYVKRDSSVIRVAKIGDPAPGSSGGTFEDILPPVNTIFPALPFLTSPNSLTSGGDLVFIGAFRRPNQQNPTFALYRHTGSTLQEIVRTGQNVGGFSIQFLTAPTFGDGGVIYCGAASQAILGGGILRIAGNQRQAQPFPGATPTEENLPPYAINRQGHAVYDHIAIAVNPNFGMPTGLFDRPAFGINISLRLHTGSPSPETLLGPVVSAPPDSPFLGFSNFAAHRSGDLLFIGNVSGGRNLFRLRENGMDLVMRSGQTIEGLTVRSVTEAAINDAGVIAVQAEIEDGSALFVLRAGTFRKVMASGDVVFSKRVVDIFDISVNQGGEIACIVNLADDTGANVQNLVLLLRPTATDYSLDPSRVIDLTALPSIRGARPIFFMDVALADTGAMALTARAPRDEAVILATPRQTGAGYTFQKIAESDGATPIGGKFRRGSELQLGGFSPEVFSSLQITPQGAISFIGEVDQSGSPRRAIFSYAGGTLTKVVADGDATPEGSPIELLPFHSLAPTGEIAFLSLTSGEPNLYLWRQGALTRLLTARQSGPSGELVIPVPPLLATNGRVVFVGVLLNADSRMAIYALAVR
jgi:hypothetical protein